MADNYYAQFEPNAESARQQLAQAPQSQQSPQNQLTMEPERAASLVGTGSVDPQEIQYWLAQAEAENNKKAAASPSASTPVAGSKEKNFYSKFEPTPRSWYEDMAWQLPQGINEGVDDFVNLFNAPRYPLAINRLFGTNLPYGERFNMLERFNPGGEYAKAITGHDQAVPPETTAGEYARSMGQAIGSSVVPEATILGKAEQLAKLAPVVEGTGARLPASASRNMGSEIGQFYANKPGTATAVGVGAGAASGAAGEAERKTLDWGPGFEFAASAFAPLAPFGAIPAAQKGLKTLGEITGTTGFGKPTMARIGTWIPADSMWRKIGLPMSADGEPIMNPANDHGVSPGAQAAGDQMIANYLVSAGKNPDDIKAFFRRYDEARRFHTSGEAQDVLGLVDADPALTKLMGTMTRWNPEVAANADNFFSARQTGLPPMTSTEEAIANKHGLPTRPDMAPPMTGKEAREKYGTQFNTSLKDNVPAGAIDRIVDAVDRALLIKDFRYHGHAPNATLTDAQLIGRMEEAATPMYNAVRAAGKDVDVSPTVSPLLDRWRALIANMPEGNPIPKAINKALDFFTQKNGSTITSIDDFDRGKRLMDGAISSALEKPRLREPAAWLTRMKNELLKGYTPPEAEGAAAGLPEVGDLVHPLAEDGSRVLPNGVVFKGYEQSPGGHRFARLSDPATGKESFWHADQLQLASKGRLPGVDEIEQNNLGKLYSDARAAYSGPAQSQRVLQWGREAPDLDPDHAKALFDTLGDKSDQKLFRKGVVGHLETAVGKMGEGHDPTKWFNRNRKRLLAHIIPKSEDAADTFANRPQLLGRYIGYEKLGMRTRKDVLGGSPTQGRAADDMAADNMAEIGDRLMGGLQDVGSKVTSSSIPFVGPLIAGAKKTIIWGLKKVGYHHDMAAAVSNRMLSANPEERRAAIDAIRARMPRDKFVRLNQLIQWQLQQAQGARSAVANPPDIGQKPSEAAEARGGRVNRTEVVKLAQHYARSK